MMFRVHAYHPGNNFDAAHNYSECSHHRYTTYLLTASFMLYLLPSENDIVLKPLNALPAFGLPLTFDPLKPGPNLTREGRRRG
jgi:hypothetical protein